MDMPSGDFDQLCPLVPVSGSAVPITGPTRITEPGEYRLAGSFEDVNETVWLEIVASNVTVDGNGQTLDGRDRTGTHGIRVGNGTAIENVAIQNMVVTDFAYGISLYNTTKSRVVLVNASSNTYDGIMTSDGSDLVISCNIIHLDDDGINLTGTDRVLVINNTVTENFRGSGIHLAHGADEVRVVANRIGYNDEGIEVEGSKDSAITQNLVWFNRYYGLNLSAAENLTVHDNYFRNRENLRPPTGLFTGAWNLTPTAGPNLLGGPSIGGNFWGDVNRTGFSETHRDGNRDGFVDVPYALTGGVGVDWHPLAPAAGGVDSVRIGLFGAWRDWLQTFFS
jgi:parallel beta-helix repeat protein